MCQVSRVDLACLEVQLPPIAMRVRQGPMWGLGSYRIPCGQVVLGVLAVLCQHNCNSTESVKSLCDGPGMSALRFLARENVNFKSEHTRLGLGFFNVTVAIGMRL